MAQLTTVKATASYVRCVVVVLSQVIGDYASNSALKTTTMTLLFCFVYVRFIPILIIATARYFVRHLIHELDEIFLAIVRVLDVKIFNRRKPCRSRGLEMLE